MNLNRMLARLKTIEQHSPDSALEIFEPEDKHAKFYFDLCRAYLASSKTERSRIEEVVRPLSGVLNHLLGFVHQSARYIRETKSKDWLMVGLAAAAIRGDGPDFRDFYMALAELYAAALEAGVDPKDEFATIGGGVPDNFHTFAVLRSRLSDVKTG